MIEAGASEDSVKTGLIAGLIVMTTSFATLAATPPALLTPDQIRTLFGTGKPFTATSVSGIKTYAFTFNPDGSAMERLKGAKKGVSGKWRVSDNGYCTTWNGGTEHCYTVDKGAKSYEVRDLGGDLISNWKP